VLGIQYTIIKTFILSDMKNNIIIICLFAFSTILIQGCGSSKSMALNSAQKTNDLRPGMTYNEVVDILGSPKSTQMVNGQLVARWNLQEMWKGYVPYDMVFNSQDQTLISWEANEADFEKKQEQMKEVVAVMEETTNETIGGNVSATGPNDQQLMQQFAGMYYSFSAVGGGQTGGTERKVSLCPDGTYREFSETGYSGDAGTANAWGSAGQGGTTGTWRIVGNINEGTITTVSASGKATEYPFSRCGNDCIYFGNAKFALAGPAQCK